MLPPVADRFVAGETADKAIAHARRRAAEDIDPMLNLLGSHHENRATVDADVAEYRLLIEGLTAAGLGPDREPAISAKPTQLGLDCDETVFRDSLERILETAAEHGVVVWLDMEERETVDPTLAAYEEFASAYDGQLGVCLQADLRRTPDDLERLADRPGKLRLVKGGAYERSPTAAYTDDRRIDCAYRRLLERAFETVDGTVAVATHDPAMIEYAIELIERSSRSALEFEFQFLMGVRLATQRDLATDYPVRQFIPYGTRWKRWALNRAKRNVGFTTRAVAESLVPFGGPSGIGLDPGEPVPVRRSGTEPAGE
ncbi:proline dehydrogenase family protein [Natrialbaceae archaeon A-gly3]